MKAVVFSGGGSKGAFQAAVLYYLLNDLEIQYSILSGVSVGAINAGFLAQFPIGEEKQAARELVNLWSELNTKSIYKNWFPFGPWAAIWTSSFYDSSPLIKLIKNNISLDRIRKAGRKISIGALSVTSGKYTVFTERDDDLIEAITASASFPGMLCPIKIRDQWWVDGGLKQLTPIQAAIDDGAYEIDVIMTSPDVRDKYFIEHPTAIDIIKRSLDLSCDKIMSNDVDKALMYNKLAEAGVSDKKVIKLNIIRPQFNLIDNVLDFSPDKIKKMMDIGYLTAKEQYKI